MLMARTSLSVAREASSVESRDRAAPWRFGFVRRPQRFKRLFVTALPSLRFSVCVFPLHASVSIMAQTRAFQHPLYGARNKSQYLKRIWAVIIP